MKQIVITFLLIILQSCAVQPEYRTANIKFSPIPLSKYIENGWHISEPMTVEEIEKNKLAEITEYLNKPDARKDVPKLPFGFANGEWEEFKTRLKPRDEIREIMSPPESWQALAGWQGYVIVRKKHVVWDMTVLKN